MHRPGRFATVIVVAALLAGCAPGIAANPHFATDVSRVAGAPETSTPPESGPPPIEAPKNDLAWRDCTTRVFDDVALAPPPDVTVECASYDADLDPINGANGTLSIGVVRARTEQTPQDAGPLVLTTGFDLPSSVQLPVWLSRTGGDVLRTRPIVAVDRRGMGRSGDLDCRSTFDRREMRDQAQYDSGSDPVETLYEISVTATTSCTDTIAPGDSAYDNAHAAEDIERLRTTWDVPALALLGIGNGAQVALAYAGRHSENVARLILDSPIPTAINAEAAAEQQIKGEQAALDTFAAQCAAANCPLGADPKDAIDELLAAARAGDGPVGVSVAAITEAISTALAFPRGDRLGATNSLAEALSSARAGNSDQLDNLIDQAESLRQTDGQFVNRCSDALSRPTPDRVRELVVAWGNTYRQFGTVGALDLVKCLNWPSGSAPPDPTSLNVDLMLLGGQNDPIVGSEGVATVAALAINAGVASKRVIWQGIGHGVSIYAPCALPPMISYIGSGNLPPSDTYCPA